jgi:hypothetical protein
LVLTNWYLSTLIMKKVATLTLFALITCPLFAQQTVSIGTTSTKSTAVLWLNGNGSQALIIPIGNKDSVTPAEKGMVIYNSADNKVYFHDGAGWSAFGGAGSAQTLSYDANTRQLSLTGGGGTVTITAQDLTKTGNTLSLTGDASTVSLANTAPTVAGQILQWDAAAGNWTSTTATAPTDGQVLKWNDTTKRWEASADNVGAAPAVDNTSIGLNGSSQLEIKALGVTDAKVASGISGAKITPNFGAQNIITTGNLSASAGTFTGNLSAAAVTFSGNAAIRGVNYVWPAANAGGVLTNNGTGTLSWAPATIGTVTSVGLSLPSILSVTGSPVTTTGTLSATLASQAAATVFAAPAGAAGAPTFRALTSTDLPNISISKITGAGAGTRAILGSDNNTLSWVTGSPDQVLGTDASGSLQFLSKSSLSFTADNVVPKGSASGLIASNIYDDGSMVGVGTTVPSRPLELNSNGNIYGFSHVEADIRTSTYNGTLTGGGYGGSIGTETNHPFYIYVANGGEKATFMQNGDVGIGTNAPAKRLHVYHPTDYKVLRLSSGSSGAGIEMISGGDDWMLTTWGGSLYLTNSSNDFASQTDQYNFSSTQFIPWQDNTKTLGSSIRRWVSVHAVNGTIQTSDRRLKENIRRLPYGLKELMQLKPVAYSWKSDPSSKKIGLIAQEVQQVVPEVVHDGEYLGMNYGELVPVLINAIQEQEQRIEQLEARVRLLEGDHTELEKLKADISAILKTMEKQKESASSDRKNDHVGAEKK